jgi:hypothetical protein
MRRSTVLSLPLELDKSSLVHSIGLLCQKGVIRSVNGVTLALRFNDLSQIWQMVIQGVIKID